MYLYEETCFMGDSCIHLLKILCQKTQNGEVMMQEANKLQAQAASKTYDILVCIDVSCSFSSLSTLLTCVYINCLLTK